MKKKQLLLTTLILISVLSSCSKEQFNSEVNLIPVFVNNEYQFINQTGETVINPNFKEASIFHDNIALVCLTGLKSEWCFINNEGQPIFKTKYKRATIFSEGVAWVINNDQSPSAINDQGIIQFSMKDADEVRIFREGFAAFSIYDNEGKLKWGFLNKEGKIIINPQFNEVNDFSGGKCAVSNDKGEWGYIDASGKIIINNQFSSANDFFDGKAIVSHNEKVGVIDNNGKFVINPQYEEMLNDGDNFIIKSDGKYGWCDASGKIIINQQFEDVSFFFQNKLAPVKFGDQWGYIDKDGKTIINPQFEAALPFNGGLGMVKSSDKVGFIDEDGKYVINAQYEKVSPDYLSHITGKTLYNSTNQIDIFSSNIDSLSYAYGVGMGTNLAQNLLAFPVKINVSLFLEVFEKSLKGDTAKLTISPGESYEVFQRELESIKKVKEIDGKIKETSVNDFSYAYGVGMGTNLAQNLQQFPAKINVDLFLTVFEKALKCDTAKLAITPQQAYDVFQRCLASEQKEAAVAVKEDAKKFLEKNAKVVGVKTTPSGLQYFVIKEGNGPKPVDSETVSVHYHGTLLDGTVFDSSVDRGTPAEFPLNRVIKGWTEGIQLMSVGSKYKFWIPSDLAYGDNGAGGQIKPGSLLIFEVELLEIK